MVDGGEEGFDVHLTFALLLRHSLKGTEGGGGGGSTGNSLQLFAKWVSLGTVTWRRGKAPQRVKKKRHPEETNAPSPPSTPRHLVAICAFNFRNFN